MISWMRVKTQLTKIFKWEFWPFNLLYFPVFMYYPWLALKCRSWFFFTAANPTIDFGGMLGESKSEIFELIPKKYLPDYLRFDPGRMEDAALFCKQIGYPVICKPDVGERGRLVEVIHNESELDTYIQKCKVSFIVQELVSYPIELGLFFVKFPDKASGRITSIVQKKFLTVTGDGEHTVSELLEKDPRAQLQVDFSHPRFRQIMDTVPSKEQQVTVEPIGNHCRGTTFLDAGNKSTQKLDHAFSLLAKKIKGFYFGRFDLRCKSFDDLENLQNFKILELNGAGAEPGHIYHPGYSLFQAYKSIFWHLSILAEISKANHERGVPYWSFKAGMKKMNMIRNHNKIIAESL